MLMSARKRSIVGVVLAALACSLVASACTTGANNPPPSTPSDGRLPAAGAVDVGSAQYAVPAGAKFVSSQGNDANDGSEARPWRTLAAAVQKSPAGSTLVLRGGTYRESVQVYRKKLTIQSYPGEPVWLSGSDVVEGWVADGGGWRRDGWTPSFERTNTHDSIDPAFPLAAWPEMAFRDGRPLRQVSSRGAVVPGTFFVDDPANRVFIGDDPAGHTVELSARPRALHLNDAHGTTVRGIGVRHYATPLNQVAAVQAFGNDITLENLVVDHNAAAGASVQGSNGIVRNSTFRFNGQMGLNGNTADGLVVERTYFEANNSERFDPSQVGAGVKVTHSRNLRFTGNHSVRNQGKGIWTDQSSYDITINGNLLQNNTRHGIHVELSAKVVIADNVSADNGDRGVAVMESNDVDVWNNSFLRNGRNIDVIEAARVSTDVTSHNHDFRYPVPDPKILWQVQRVRIYNNVVVGKNGATNSLFRVEDAAHLRSADAMQVTLDHNAWYRPSTSSPSWVAMWATYPAPIVISTSLADFQSRTGNERNGVGRTGGIMPWVRNESALDFRVPEAAPGAVGAPLPAAVADALGRTAGVRVPIGALSMLSSPRT
jgi:parallel beta-helix repeat protein